jgi:hypothetical protein
MTFDMSGGFSGNLMTHASSLRFDTYTYNIVQFYIFLTKIVKFFIKRQEMCNT